MPQLRVIGVLWRDISGSWLGLRLFKHAVELVVVVEFLARYPITSTSLVYHVAARAVHVPPSTEALHALRIVKTRHALPLSRPHVDREVSLGVVGGDAVEAALISVRPVAFLVHLMEPGGKSLCLFVKNLLFLVVLSMIKDFTIESEQLAQSLIDLKFAVVALKR